MPARILIVEDDPDAAALMAALLRKRGHEVVCAGDAEKGAALAPALQPDLIISDIQLPGIDGYELVRRLRHDPAMRRVRAIAVSTFTLGGARARALDAGFDGFIAKPFLQESFAQQVEQFLV